MSAASESPFSLPQIAGKGRRKGEAGGQRKSKVFGKGEAKLPWGRAEDALAQEEAANLLLSRDSRGCVSASRDIKHYKFLAARSLVVASPGASRVWFLFEQAIF